MRILYFSSRECWPLNTGARLRDYHFARQLARRAEVTYYGLRNQNDPPMVPIPADAGLQEQVIVEKDESYSPGKLLKGLIGPVPVTLLNCQNEPAKATLEKLLLKSAFDSVQLEGVHLVGYVPTIRSVSPNTAIVGDWHNIESEIMRRYSQTTSGLARKLYARRTAGLIEDMELRLLRACDIHSIASQRELERLRQREPKAKLVAVGNGVDVEAHSPAEIEAAWNRMDARERPAEGSVLFVGSMDYHANIDGAIEFARQIWPRFQEAERNSSAEAAREFVIVGRNPASEVTALAATPGIRVTGTVPDVRGYYRGALAVAVPLRIGSGTRLKILEAMAAGVPVVATAVGGIPELVEDGKTALLVPAKNVTALANALRKIMQSSGLRNELARAAGEVVAAHSPRAYFERMREIFQEVAGN